MSTNNYESSYSESGLWTKIEKFAKKAVKKLFSALYNIITPSIAKALHKFVQCLFSLFNYIISE